MTLELLSKTTWNSNDQTRVLILGNGYVGGYLYKYLEKEGYDVSIKKREELDYHNIQVLNKFLLNNAPDVVINSFGFTGKPNIDEAEVKKEECWNLNTYIPVRINELCNKLSINYIQISSGCIYDGYQKEFTEEDFPNFGLFENHSSFYSKSKHSFEQLSKHLYNRILRLRMPFGPDISSRNYLSKIRRYDNLIDYKNSKTYIPDLCGFVSSLLKKEGKTTWKNQEIYNIVNPNPLTTKEVCEIMKSTGHQNNNWKFVPIKDIPIVAGRSNCVLISEKASQLYQFQSEEEAIRKALAL